MADLRATIVPKSDQLNFDDFLGNKPMTIKITKVSAVNGDQPISIHYEGDNGKPWKPCKGMRRVLVHVWGPDGNTYIGRSVTLYGDPTVVFGGLAVGGIRISHMSHIDKEVTMALTATRANRKPFTVKPLATQDEPPQQSAFLSHDQRQRIVTAMGDIVKPADLLKQFKVGKSTEIPADKYEEVMAWIEDMKLSTDHN